MKQCYRLEQTLVFAGQEDFQKVLAQAYAKGDRPSCGCNEEEPKLYIAKIASRNLYELRRMPNTGHQHSVDCDHYEPPPGLSGLAQVQGQAIIEDAKTDTVDLKLDFSLSKISGRALPTPKDTPADSVKSDGTKLTLRGLMHYLWHAAQLDKWYPAMKGKRTYGTIYKYLTHAAIGKVAKSQPLADMLYLPEPHDPAKDSQIRSRRLLRLTQLASSASPSSKRLGLLIGEVYELRPAQFGYQAIFKGAMDCPFRVNEDLYNRMMKHFQTSLTIWDQHLSDSHLMLIGTFIVDTAGLPTLHEVAVMNVTQNWIPFETVYEKTLIDELTQQGRQFWKCLRFNLPATASMASAVLTDSDVATAMCILPPGSTQDDQEEMTKQIGSDKMPMWVWRAGEQEIPRFPMTAS